jgi:sarcosine oxidase subunit beta
MSGRAYDLIIIGAGSIGIPAALAAQRAGMKTLIVDGRASPGQGDAKTAIGGVRATHSDPAKIKICLRSLKTFAEWQEKEGDYLGWNMGGYLYPIFSGKDEETLKGNLEVQKSHRLNIDWIGPEQVKELVPGIRERDLRGGTFSPEDGSVSPLRCSSAFFFAAQREGAEFKFNETVVDTKVSGGRVVSVVTDRGEYACANVLNAAGSNAAEVGRQVGLELPVHPDSHEAGITEPVARFFKPLIVDIRATPGGKNCYFYQNSENRIEFCLTPDPIFPGTNRDSTSSFLPRVARKIVDLFPKMANIRVRRIWRGCYPQTPDGNPIVGSAKEIGGYHFAVGMCGHGFMLGPGLADDIVGRIKDGKTVTDEEMFKRFSLDRDFSAGEEALR